MAMRAGMSCLSELRTGRVGGSGWLRHLEQHAPARELEAGADAAEEEAPTGHEFDAERIVARVRAARGGCGRPSASLTRTVA